MAKFGTDVTTMSAPGLGGAGFIAEGVVDKSKAISTAATTGLIAAAGEAGVGAYKGKQLADIETAREQTIQEYMDRRNPEMLAEQAAREKAGEISLFQQPGVTPEELSPVQKSFNDKIERYRKAKEQGVMSGEEFSLRLTKDLRDAVNKNPGMIQELSDHATKVLELSGITDIIKSDKSNREAVAKGQDDFQKYYMEIAKTNDITVPFTETGTVNMPALVAKVKAVQEEKALISGYNRQSEFKEEQFKTNGTALASGLVNNATEQAIALISDPTIPYDKAIVSVNMLIDSMERDFSLKTGSIIDKPSVQSTLTIIKNQAASLKENLKKFASKEEAAAYLRNTTDMLRNQQYLAVSQTVNPVALDVLSKSMAVPGIANLISKYPEKMVMVSDSISKLAQGLNTDATTLYQQNTPGEKPIGVQILSDQLNTAGTGDEKSVSTLANTIKTFNSDMVNMQNPKDKFVFQEKYIKTLGGNTAKAGLSRLDDVAATTASHAVDEYTQTTLGGFLNQMRTYQEQGVQITLDKLPDGRISIKSDRPEITDELTKRYTIRLNDSLAAYANLTGSSMSEASPKFFSTYGKYFGVQSQVQEPSTTPITAVTEPVVPQTIHESPQVTRGTIKR